MTLVSEAMSNIVSRVITSGAGTNARWPYAFRNTTVSPWPTSTTAPGSFFSAIASATTSSIFASRVASTRAAPVVAGVATCACGIVTAAAQATTPHATSHGSRCSRVMAAIIRVPHWLIGSISAGRLPHDRSCQGCVDMQICFYAHYGHVRHRTHATREGAIRRARGVAEDLAVAGPRVGACAAPVGAGPHSGTFAAVWCRHRASGRRDECEPRTGAC